MRMPISYATQLAGIPMLTGKGWHNVGTGTAVAMVWLCWAGLFLLLLQFRNPDSHLSCASDHCPDMSASPAPWGL